MNSKQQLQTDDELLQALKNPRRCDDGIRTLYQKYLGLLTSYVVNNSGNEEDAQDIFQEVVVSFVHLVQEDKFRRESSIKTFLYAMNRHLWLNELKRRGRVAQREKKFEELQLQNKGEIEHAIEHREATTQLMTVIDRLGADCKKILLLFYFENRSMRDILSETNYENEQVVRNKKYKCLKKLEEMLQAQTSIYEQLKSFFHG